MRIAVTGSSGLLGQALIRSLQRDHVILPLTRSDADITARDSVNRTITNLQPDMVIHTAAVRGLDFCESYPDIAWTVNLEGTRNVLDAAMACGAGICFVSSDAVFSGERSAPYSEIDEPKPCSVYAQTKVAAEQIVSSWPNHRIFRVSLLFGPGKENFVERALRILAAGGEYNAATDQIGSATYTPDAGETIKQVIERGVRGLFHLSNAGICSRFDLVCRAVSIAGLDISKVRAMRRDEFHGAATRSEFCGMKMNRLAECGIPAPRALDDALKAYIETLVF
jgi:dTDP-4-dehydrorhamnose reductase